jgi:hypothetical protein
MMATGAASSVIDVWAKAGETKQRAARRAVNGKRIRRLVWVEHGVFKSAATVAHVAPFAT